MSKIVKIYKIGEKMNSPNPKQRNIYIESKPESLTDLINTLKNLKSNWMFETANLNQWYKYMICKYCLQRMKYELEKFKAAQWVWNRRYCFRHYLVEHLDDISSFSEMIISNRLVGFTITKDKIAFKTRTHNYNYNIFIDRDHTDVTVLYKNKTYTFRYNNHTNSTPYASSYATILSIVIRVVEMFRDAIEDIEDMIKNKECSNISNIYINNLLLIPACPSES